MNTQSWKSPHNKPEKTSGKQKMMSELLFQDTIFFPELRMSSGRIRETKRILLRQTIAELNACT